VRTCRRHPQQTAGYQVVQHHREMSLALAGEDDWGDGPELMPDRDLLQQLRPAFQFDQRVSC
jgi:hypothetical protein